MPVFQPICRSFHGSHSIYTCYSNSTDAVPMKSRNSPYVMLTPHHLSNPGYALWENGSMFRCFIGRLCFIFLRFTTTHLNPCDPISVIQLQENWTSKYHWIDFKFYLSRGFVVSWCTYGQSGRYDWLGSNSTALGGNVCEEGWKQGSRMKLMKEKKSKTI